MDSLTTSIASVDDTARFLRFVTWNVAGRVRALPEQAAALAAVGADVICLQEVTVRTEPLWRDALAAAGLASCESAVALLPAAPTRRRLAVLTAARSPLTRLAAPDVPWPERLLLCALDGGPEVINLHSPIAPGSRAGQDPHPRGRRGPPRVRWTRPRACSAATSTRRAASSRAATC